VAKASIITAMACSWLDLSADLIGAVAILVFY
jgi:hypothetical protein